MSIIALNLKLKLNLVVKLPEDAARDNTALIRLRGWFRCVFGASIALPFKASLSFFFGIFFDSLRLSIRVRVRIWV